MNAPAEAKQGGNSHRNPGVIDENYTGQATPKSPNDMTTQREE